MSTLIIELLSSVSSLRARLGNRHAEKLIPPHELENIQSLWDESNENEKCDIFAELDEYDRDEMKRLFTLLARQKDGIKSLISIRAASVSNKIKSQSVVTLTDVLQSNLDSSLDINRITLDSTPVLPILATADRVHQVQSEQQFRRRFAEDRRVFTFSHKQNHNQPLMLLNIALTDEISNSIHDIVDGIENDHVKKCAIFYSISSLELGLRGIDLGHRLIVASVDKMRSEPDSTLEQFSSLSPVPNFRRWLQANLDSELIRSTVSPDRYDSFVDLVKSSRVDLVDSFKDELLILCTHYLTKEKRPDQSMECAVGNFHIRNGATLWRINFGANKFDYGMRESLSIMVNYRYYFDKMWNQAYNYQTDRTVTCSDLI